MLALLLALPAHAMDCYEITGWTGSGSIGDSALVAPISCSFSSAGWEWFQVTLSYSSPWPDDLWVVVPPTDPHLSGSTFYPLMVLAGADGSGYPEIYLDLIVGDGGSEMYGQSNPPEHCWQDVDWWDGTSVDAWWDTANCYVEAVPAGQTGFVYDGNYYLTTQPACPVGVQVGSACYVTRAGVGSFVANNSFYDSPYAVSTDGSRYLCRRGRWDGTGCLVGVADPDTTAYATSRGFYTTLQALCADGQWDTANCYLGTAPAGTTPFVWAGAFYYGE